MTTNVSFGQSDWPLSIKARNSADGVTLLVQTDDWREGITIRNDRAAVLAVLREAVATVEALGCEYGWGCTDTTCTEHGAELRDGLGAYDAPCANGCEACETVPFDADISAFAAKYGAPVPGDQPQPEPINRTAYWVDDL